MRVQEDARFGGLGRVVVGVDGATNDNDPLLKIEENNVVRETSGETSAGDGPLRNWAVSWEDGNHWDHRYDS